MNRRQLLSACLLAGLLGGYWFLLAQGELAQISGLETRIRGLHASQGLSELGAQGLDEYQRTADEAQAWLERVVEAHTAVGAAPELHAQVEAELQACGLAARDSRPGPVTTHERLEEQSLELSVDAEPERLLEFLYRIEESRPFCRVTELRVAPGFPEGHVRASLVLTRLWREV